MPETEQPQIDSEEVATQKEAIEGRPEEAEQAPEKNTEQLKLEIAAKKEAFTKDRDTVAEELRKLEELGDEADAEELTGIRAELADIDEQMKNLEAEEKALTAPETTETKAEEKTYGAKDLDELMQAFKRRQEKKHPDYPKDDHLNFSEGDLIGTLMDGAKRQKGDSKSLLASLDSSGIQKLQEIASQSKVRNQEMNKNVAPEYTNANKLEKLAQQAEQLASLRSEEGQRKFVQDITESLNAGTNLNRKTTNKIDSALSLLQKHDNDTKNIIFDQIKPALLDAVKDSTLESDKGIVDRIVEEYQS